MTTLAERLLRVLPQAGIGDDIEACLAILAEAEAEIATEREQSRVFKRNWSLALGERDASLRRCREASQTLVECIGAPGPLYVEDAAKSAVAEVERLRASVAALDADRVKACEALVRASAAHSVAQQERDAALAKMARYEAPGPALLVAEHDGECGAVVGWVHNNTSDSFGDAQWDMLGEILHDMRDAAYREQHARCVAVVEAARLPEEHTEECDAYSERVGRRKCINALCDGEVRAEAAEKQLAACLATLKDGAR